jgi:DNA-binding NarL/FixJ family response regulator
MPNVRHESAGTAKSGPRRIFVVDDHPLIREGLAAQIATDPTLEICGEAESIETAVLAIAAAKPDLVIVDISLKDGSGIDLIERLKASALDVPTLVWSMHVEIPYVEHALEVGARGYVHKSRGALQIMDAIHTVLRGEIYLSNEISDRFRGRPPIPPAEE